jgi:hypothetical protein
MFVLVNNGARGLSRIQWFIKCLCGRDADGEDSVIEEHGDFGVSPRQKPFSTTFNQALAQG